MNILREFLCIWSDWKPLNEFTLNTGKLSWKNFHNCLACEFTAQYACMQVYSQYLWNTVFSKGKIWVFAGARGQMNTTLCQNRPEKTQNWTNLYLKPHDCQIYYANINLRHQYGISVAESQTFLRAKRPQRRRARRNGCFRRLLFLIFAIFLAQSFHVARKILVTFAIFAKFAISSILLW